MKPLKKRLEFLDWEFGVLFHFGVRTFYLDRADWDCVPFPAGDPFSVYPYGDGVAPSLRLKVFKQALDDMRLLELWGNKIGKADVVKRIEQIAETEITFDKYPKGEKIFDMITAAAINDLTK